MGSNPDDYQMQYIISELAKRADTIGEILTTNSCTVDNRHYLGLKLSNCRISIQLTTDAKSTTENDKQAAIVHEM